AWKLWKEDRVWEFMDPILAESYHPQKLVRCIHVGLLCVQEHAADRPTMSTIVAMLGCDSTVPSPKQPAFSLGREVQSGDAYSDASSTNDVTVTIVEGR
ncbi:Cysteine-rich receptor-like protein kinase, partial [Thalictrum thalictroides]